jgi:prolipoprotein diacylglyceryltransferase
MTVTLVVALLALCLAVLFAWSFRHLPGERWQVLAALPRQREAGGAWRGVNLTYYGLFNSLGVAAAVTVAVFLAGTAGLPLAHLACGLLAILAVCVPASRIANRIVEGHWHGFTIGGASFIGMVVGPWLVWGVSRLTTPGDGATTALYVLGALSPAYALGEGIGRLACISFGCCYGRPLTDCPAWLRKLFRRWAFVFEGRLKKASYAHGFEGQRLIPVQAMTAILSSAAGLVGFALFLCGRPVPAYVLPIVATQVWRFVSEFLRADYRRPGRVTAYQWMALAGAACTVMFGLLWPGSPRPAPDVARGLALLWTPGAILLIQIIAGFVFVHMGVSTVTTSHVAFDLRQDRLMSPRFAKDAPTART